VMRVYNIVVEYYILYYEFFLLHRMLPFQMDGY